MFIAPIAELAFAEVAAGDVYPAEIYGLRIDDNQFAVVAAVDRWGEVWEFQLAIRAYLHTTLAQSLYVAAF